MEIKVVDAKQGPALGSAIYGALAAGKAGGGYDSVEEASRAMGKNPAAVYTPIAENKAVYDKLYAEYSDKLLAYAMTIWGKELETYNVEDLYANTSEPKGSARR
jgi:ribulose kinase